jgi:hypothetical protein
MVCDTLMALGKGRNSEKEKLQLEFVSALQYVAIAFGGLYMPSYIVIF